jgi:hypothetical protein
MPHERTDRQIHDMLLNLPLQERIVSLCVSLIHEEPQGPFALMTMIKVAQMLAKHLPQAERTSIIWHLNECAEELRARWN